MRKLLTALCTVCVFFLMNPVQLLLAAESGNNNEPSNVTITVVMPESSPMPIEEPVPDTPKFTEVYPSDVTEIRDSLGWQIIKSYELKAGETPEAIPRDSFERGGWTFTLTDIIRQETANAETREHTETVTLDTSTKELEKILPQLSPTVEYMADDGFVGILSLDVSSIKVETAGTKTSSYTSSITREYPHLSTNDSSMVPKSVVDKGLNYTLASVSWQAGNNVTVDYNAMPEYYTAIATYTATGTSTKVTGYITTATYTGTLAKLSPGKTVYTAYFTGAEIRTPLKMILPSEEGETKNQTQGALLVIILIIAILAGGAYYFYKRKVNDHAKTFNSVSGAADDSDGGNSGSGG